MTGAEAREIVAEMKRKTSRIAMRQLLRHAVNGSSAYKPNLSPEAIAVYREALDEFQQCAP
jgi:hypothetical protein